tara:strand:- start:3180 stop:3368 length:189 start_codon:yes stop_codon:yes gene_type:complete
LYYLTKQVIVELLDKEIRKADRPATRVYFQELTEIKKNFLETLDQYNIELKSIQIIDEEDLI